MLDNDFIDDEKLQRAGKRPFRLFLLLAGVVIVGCILLGGWFMLGHVQTSTPSAQPSTDNGATVTGSGSSQQTSSNKTANGSVPPVAFPATYMSIMKQQIAQSLHLTTTQLQSQMQASPSGLSPIARDQDVPPSQIPTILVNASQAASDQMVSTGAWTQQQSDQNMQYWRDMEQNLDAYKQKSSVITNWLRE